MQVAASQDVWLAAGLLGPCRSLGVCGLGQEAIPDRTLQMGLLGGLGQEMRAGWPRPAPGPLQPQLHLLRASLGPLWVLWCVKLAPPPWACSSARMGRVPDSFWPRLRAIFTDSPQKDSGFAKALEGRGQQEAGSQGAGRPGKAGAQHMGTGVH